MNFLTRNQRAIPSWQQFLSFFYPLEIAKSQTSPYLEIILDHNVLKLNSLHANQSNDSLKKAFDLLFHEIRMYKKRNIRLLLLGMGFGSIIELLQDKNSLQSITTIEHNEQIIHWLNIYYQIRNMDILHDTAESIHTILHPGEHFDLIIVDLFQDNQTPLFLNQKSYWIHLQSHLVSDGTLIWNTNLHQPPSLEFDTHDIFRYKWDVFNWNRFWIA